MNKTLIICDNSELFRFIKAIYHSFEQMGYEIDFNSSSPNSLFNTSGLNLNDTSVIYDITQKYDVIISLHCTQIFPKKLYENIRCINIHPGYNPYNRGYYPHIHSIINGLPTGATIHEINGIIDGGDIIVQEKVDVLQEDTSLSVYTKIMNTERLLILKYLTTLIDGNYTTHKIKEVGQLKTKKEYNEMCNLQLSNVGTLEQHINLLRALSHGDYNNAYFYNEEGKKIFIKITLSKDEN